MAACPEVRYDTAAAAYEQLVGADASRRGPRLSPCGACRGWHLVPRRVARAQWLARRRRFTAGAPSDAVTGAGPAAAAPSGAQVRRPQPG